MTRSTFSTTTMASSTSRPIASTTPNMVSVLMREAGYGENRRRCRGAPPAPRASDERRARVPQEEIHDEEDEDDRFEERLSRPPRSRGSRRAWCRRVSGTHSGKRLVSSSTAERDPVGGVNALAPGGEAKGHARGRLAVVSARSSRSSRPRSRLARTSRSRTGAAALAPHHDRSKSAGPQQSAAPSPWHSAAGRLPPAAHRAARRRLGRSGRKAVAHRRGTARSSPAAPDRARSHRGLGAEERHAADSGTRPSRSRRQTLRRGSRQVGR